MDYRQAYDLEQFKVGDEIALDTSPKYGSICKYAFGKVISRSKTQITVEYEQLQFTSAGQPPAKVATTTRFMLQSGRQVGGDTYNSLRALHPVYAREVLAQQKAERTIKQNQQRIRDQLKELNPSHENAASILAALAVEVADLKQKGEI